MLQPLFQRLPKGVLSWRDGVGPSDRGMRISGFLSLMQAEISSGRKPSVKKIGIGPTVLSRPETEVILWQEIMCPSEAT